MAKSSPSLSHDSPSRDSGRTRVRLGGSTSGIILNPDSRPPVEWNFFDPEAEVEISERDRPHWDQTGAVTFVTIHLIDSMPKAVVARLQEEQCEWLRQRGFDTSQGISNYENVLANAPKSIYRSFVKFKNQRWHESLDQCHGGCLLRQQRYAEKVAESLLRFDGERYDVERLVVMPNHVHVLVQMRGDWKLRGQCESWTRFTSGEFWAEPFDHIVRNDDQFLYLQEYIVQNPVKARLREGQYLLWIRGIGHVAIARDL